METKEKYCTEDQMLQLSYMFNEVKTLQVFIEK